MVSPARVDANVDDAGPVADLHAMLAESDFVVVNCPLTEATRGLVDAAALAAMRPTGVLVNVIMIPHASGWSEGLLDRRWAVIAANLDRLARGEPLANRLAGPEG